MNIVFEFERICFKLDCLVVDESQESINVMPRKKEYDPSEVLQKAMYVFWKNGYRSTSLRMLEKELGINQFSIYSSFQNKHNLFVEVLKKYREHMREGIVQILINSEGDLKDIEHFYKAFIDAVQNGESPNGCLVANTAAEIGSSDSQIHEALKAYFGMMEEAFYELLRKSKAKGQLDEDIDPREKAKYLVTCTEGLSLSSKVMDESDLHSFISSVVTSLQR
jgi:TetR/AcrR family transcriptional repressor of nem operon